MEHLAKQRKAERLREERNRKARARRKRARKACPSADAEIDAQADKDTMSQLEGLRRSGW